MGLYSPEESAFGAAAMISEKASPALKVRPAGQASSFEGLYKSIPVFSYLSKNTPEDDITPGGCTYANSYNNDHWNKKETYDTVSDYILPVVRDQVGRAFGKSKAEAQNMTFVNLYEYSDVLLAENMEGTSPRANFTNEQWHHIRAV
jgi:hypothetical protein